MTSHGEICGCAQYYDIAYSLQNVTEEYYLLKLAFDSMRVVPQSRYFGAWIQPNKCCRRIRTRAIEHLCSGHNTGYGRILLHNAERSRCVNG